MKLRRSFSECLLWSSRQTEKKPSIGGVPRSFCTSLTGTSGKPVLEISRFSRPIRARFPAKATLEVGQARQKAHIPRGARGSYATWCSPKSQPARGSTACAMRVPEA